LISVTKDNSIGIHFLAKNDKFELFKKISLSSSIFALALNKENLIFSVGDEQSKITTFEIKTGKNYNNLSVN
jgi:hypothetical protein